MSHVDVVPAMSVVNPGMNAVITGIGEPARVKGVVRKMKGGYGFIAGYDGKDYFMHWTAMQKGQKDFRQVNMGDRVEFEPLLTPEGKLRAIEVAVVG